MKLLILNVFKTRLQKIKNHDIPKIIGQEIANEIKKAIGQNNDKEEKEQETRKRKYRVISPKSDLQVVGLKKAKLTLEASITGPRCWTGYQDQFGPGTVRNTFLFYGAPGKINLLVLLPSIITLVSRIS